MWFDHFLLDAFAMAGDVVLRIVDACVPLANRVAQSKQRLLRPLPTDTGDAWRDRQNTKLNATALVKIHDSDGWR